MTVTTLGPGGYSRAPGGRFDLKYQSKGYVQNFTVLGPGGYSRPPWASFVKAIPPDNIGSRITGGTFSRGRWREIVGAQRALEARALTAKRKREQEALAEATAASAAALREAEYREIEEAAELRRLTDAIEAAAGATRAKERMRQVAEITAAAKAFAYYIEMLEDEEEAITLLLLH